MFNVTPRTECEPLVTHYYHRLILYIDRYHYTYAVFSRNVRGIGNDLSCALSRIQTCTDHPWWNTGPIRQKHIIPHNTLLALSLQEGSMCRAPFRHRYTLIQIMKATIREALVEMEPHRFEKMSNASRKRTHPLFPL